MLHTTSLRISPELSDKLDDLAVRRDVTVSALMRDILLEYVGDKRGDFREIHDHLRFTINLTLKTLYLVRFLAEGVDRTETTDLIKEADDFLRENGLGGTRSHEEDDHG